MLKKVLLLEDDSHLAESLAREFEDHGYLVSRGQRLSEIPSSEIFDFAVLDLRLEGEIGLDAISVLLAQSPACRIVMLTGYGSITTAVEAVKRGAADYLTKPASFAQIEAALLGKRTALEAELKSPSLSQIESEYIDFVMTRNNGNISKTAKELGLHRQSLQRKLKKYT